MKLSENIFFLLLDGNIVLWDYRNNAQYIVNDDYFDSLVEMSKGQTVDEEKLKEFASLGLIDNEEHCWNWGWDKLSEIFHIGTSATYKDDSNISAKEACEQFLDSCSSLEGYPELFQKRDGEVTDLELPDACMELSSPFIDVLKKRRTIRDFDENKSISIEDLSSILYYTFAKQNKEDFKYHYHRTSSSGGGLHPSEAYIFASNVLGLHKGVYHYDSECHHLVRVNDYPNESLGEKIMHQFFADRASCGILISSNFKREQWKYDHSRAYRVCLMDAGHLSQTLQLVATSLGLSTWVSGAFYDDALNEVIGVDGVTESSLLYLSLGYPFGDNPRVSREEKMVRSERRKNG